MSRTYSIVCDTCREALWIGQDNIGAGEIIYRDSEGVLLALEMFLFKHESQDDNQHMMRYVCDYDIEIRDNDDPDEDHDPLSYKEIPNNMNK